MNATLLLAGLLMGDGPAVRFDPPAAKYEPPAAPLVTIAKPKCDCGPTCPKGGCDACSCPKKTAAKTADLPEWRWESLPGIGMGRVHKSTPVQGPWTVDRPAEEPARPKASAGTESPSTPPTTVQPAAVSSSRSIGLYRADGTFIGVRRATSGFIDPNCVSGT